MFDLCPVCRKPECVSGKAIDSKDSETIFKCDFNFNLFVMAGSLFFRDIHPEGYFYTLPIAKITEVPKG